MSNIKKFLFFHKIPPGLSDYQLLSNPRDFLDSKIQIPLFMDCGYLSANSRSTFRNLGAVLSRIKSVTTQRYSYINTTVFSPKRLSAYPSNPAGAQRFQPQAYSQTCASLPPLLFPCLSTSRIRCGHLQRQRSCPRRVAPEAGHTIFPECCCTQP